MRYIKGLLFAVLFTAAVIGCSGDSGSMMLALGGPEASPADSAEQALDVEAGDSSQVTAESSSTETDSAGIQEDLSTDYPTTKQTGTVGTAATETGDSGQEASGSESTGTVQEITETSESVASGEPSPAETEIQNTEEANDIAADLETKEEAAGGTQSLMTFTLDTSAGRWFQTPAGSVVSAAEYESRMAQIAEYQNKILEMEEKVTGNKGKGQTDEDRGVIAQLMEKIQKIRDEIGYGSGQNGIHTYWANENLYLRVRNVPESSWYRLQVVAKNYGKLPEWYDYFNVNVINDSTGNSVGGLFIRASDDRYRRGSLLVFLEKGDTDLNLVWNNDAYEKDEYDANIQISKVSLRETNSQRAMHKLVRRAHQYSEIQGRFFWDNNSVRTYWADQSIGFNFPNLESGKYRVIITAKNYGDLPLPKGYSNFEVSVDADGTSGVANIKASERNWERGYAVLDLTGGNTNIFLTWLNDSYREGEYDANIQIKNIRLQRIGNSERSALAAYLLGATGRNKGIVAGALIFIMMAIGALVLLNRRRARAQI
ncbi:MAG: hypothetical protein JXA20_01780 [Spirochaetes bacterium]|nr:hypothetical protein [Spirochaetota bacterium]